MSSNLTPVALDGYEATSIDQNPHLPSSPNYLAWCLGHWMRNKGMPTPACVFPSRGYVLKANGRAFDMRYEDHPRELTETAPA
ncbi:hypothetical protein AACH06_25705 [Ideonella sp. DXS29W]|uniref:Uncharacterized protein n=1 Tax=Ideonella lacteola TaxID=2984193 RepID=A0ABU9BWI5_9BURK